MRADTRVSLEKALLHTEFRCEIVAEPARLPEVIHFKETTEAVTVVIPTGVVHDGIEAYADDVRAPHLCLSNLGANVSQPAWTGAAFGASFADEDGAAVAVPYFEEHLVQRTMLSVADGRPLAVMDPLVVPVIVDADDIETGLGIGGAP